jgi:SAM-dependent MidA family methyltransferase
VGLVPWESAWREALYGDRGFYRGIGPAGHFETATHGGPGAVLADALARLAVARGLRQVVDIGAGRGELLTQMAALDTTVDLVGVDVVPRPADLADRIGWIRSPGGADLPADLGSLTDTLLLAHEWLDVVPCPVAEVDTDGVLRVVLVDWATGHEALGEPLAGADLQWATQWWPTRSPGDRVEVGRARDDAWAHLTGRLRSGLAVAVDYGHTLPNRPPAGTLTGYRTGSQVAPVPDGSCDITAHVAMDTLRHTRLVTQREMLRDLGVSGRIPDVAQAHTDPAAYVDALAWASHAATLLAPGGYGGFFWAVLDRP